MSRANIAIVGASLAGLHAARTLRDEGYAGRITLIGSETHLPYDRPPLSKSFLSSEATDAEIALCADGVVAADVELYLGRSATALDVGGRRLTLDDGACIAFTGLILACGARARRLPTRMHLPGVHTLRDVTDARAIRAAFERHPQRVVVIGGGFIGGEVAASARGRGLAVTLVEQLPAPGYRALGPAVGAALAQLYRTNGIDLRLGVGVSALSGHGHVERVELDDGTTIEADLVIVGIGVTPNVEWLADSGLPLADGIVCDRTTLVATGVTVAGDVARRPNTRDGGTLRIEHWDNAIAQGAAAARRLLCAAHDAPDFDPVPWFWSDQFDWNMQLAGHPNATDDTEILTGSLAAAPFCVVYSRAGKPTGVLGVNAGAPVRKARKLLAKGVSRTELQAAIG